MNKPICFSLSAAHWPLIKLTMFRGQINHFLCHGSTCQESITLSLLTASVSKHFTVTQVVFSQWSRHLHYSIINSLSCQELPNREHLSFDCLFEPSPLCQRCSWELEDGGNPWRTLHRVSQRVSHSLCNLYFIISSLSQSLSLSLACIFVLTSAKPSEKISNSPTVLCNSRIISQFSYLPFAIQYLQCSVVWISMSV